MSEQTYIIVGASLRGESERDTALVHPDDSYEHRQIELVTGCAATRLDPILQTVTLDDGRRPQLRKAAADQRVPTRADCGVNRRQGSGQLRAQ